MSDTGNRVWARIIFASLPVLSFAAQYALSARAGTLDAMRHHPTVMVVDWVFIPFNWYVLPTIDWTRGSKIYAICILSLLANVFAHAYWQTHGLDPGHMITHEGVTLPAGWVHLIFSTAETSLLAAFVFCRCSSIVQTHAPTVFAVLYFIAMFAAGYSIHSRFVASDVIVFTTGLFFVLVYPRTRRPHHAADH